MRPLRSTLPVLFIVICLIVLATASGLIASRVLADMPYEEAYPFTISPNNYAFSLSAGKTATTTFMIGTLGYASRYSVDTDSSCKRYDDESGKCIEYVPDALLCDYLSLSDTEYEDEYNHLDYDTDPTDTWMLTLTAPCIEGSCPDGYDDTYRRPLPRALIGTQISCNVRVESAPVLVKSNLFGNLASLLLGRSAYATTDPYYVLRVTATITENTQEPACTEDCYSNVLFLPGIEASRLFDADGDRLWEPGGEARDLGADDDVHELLMHPDGTSVRSDIYTDNIIDNAYVPVKGNVYKSFIDSMNGLVDDGTIAAWEALPYDWRYDPQYLVSHPVAHKNGPFTMLDEVQRMASSSKTGKVTIIAHSYGGLVTKALVQALGDNASRYIDRIIFVAVPQAGTPQAVGALLHGYDQGLPSAWLGNYAMSPADARELGRNMPMAYYLLPSEAYFTHTDDPAITFDSSTFLEQWREQYGARLSYPENVYGIHSSERLQHFMTDPSHPVLFTTDELTAPSLLNGTLVADAQAGHATLDSWVPPADIEMIEIAGWGEDTLATIEYYQGVASVPCTPVSGLTCTGYTMVPKLQYKPKTVIDGDGTVIESSALWLPSSTGVKKYWIDLKRYNNDPINFVTNPLGRQHADIFEVNDLRILIQDIVMHSEEDLPKYIQTTQPPSSSSKRLHYTLHSPLSLDLYDDQGNHTGLSTTTGEVEENIPDSRYEVFGEVKYISVPASVTTRLVMNGYASGSFTLDVEKVQGNTILASTTFAAVPSATNTIVTFNIPANTTLTDTSPLKVDIDGNGAIDLSLAPVLNGMALPDLTPPDTTAPEAIISVDPATKDLKIEGVDDTSSTTITKTDNTYIITDAAGNTTKLFFQKTYAGKLLSFAKLTGIRYNNAPIVPVAVSSLLYLWNPLTNPPTLLSQTIVVNNTFGIEAIYDKKKNKTTVLIKKKGAQIQTQTVTGLRVIKLITNKGVIGYEL